MKLSSLLKNAGRMGAAMVSAVKKSDDLPPLYRGDSRSVDDIFKNGFTARDPNMPLEEHLYSKTGNHGLIATSTDRDVSMGFAIGNAARGKGNGEVLIYKIRNTGGGFKVEYGKLDKKFKHLKAEHEYYWSRIEPGDIVGAWRVNRQGKRTWIPNPNYVE